MENDKTTIIELVKKNVYMVEPDVIVIKEHSSQKMEILEQIWKRINKLIVNLDAVSLIVDLRDAPLVPPPSDYREIISRNITEIKPYHVALVTGKKYLFNTIAKFMMGRFELKSYSVHKTFKKAVEAVTYERAKQ